MPDLTTTAVSLYRKLFGAPAGSKLSEQGVDTVLDGHTAIALCEAMISDDAVMGGSFPTAGADLAWRSQLQQQGLNFFGGRLNAHEAESPRGALAATIGLALSGRRATTFLAGPDVAAAQDLLVSASGRHLPIVVHLTNRSIAAQGGAIGSGHEAYHISADTGIFTLFASSVQEAVDFTYIARRVAEETLVPGLVAMDCEATALSVQDVRLLSPDQISRFLGPAEEKIPAQTEAQKLLFGDTRRRVPKWFDPDRPVLQGALYGKDGYALGAGATGPYFTGATSDALASAFEVFERLTGRKYGVIDARLCEDASVVILAQGAATEVIAAVADSVRRERKINIGSIAVRSVRPFPTSEIARHLKGKKQVVVMERLDTPMAGDAPLLREVRSCLAGADRSGATPSFHSVHYGLGGQPLLVSDLVALCEALVMGGDSGAGIARELYLGTNFGGRETRHPKRQVLTDALHRAYPDARALGFQAKSFQAKGSEDDSLARNFNSQDSIAVAIHRMAGRGNEEISFSAGELLGELEGGTIRSLPGVSWERSSVPCVDLLCCAPDGFPYTGEDARVDLAVVASKSVYAPLTRIGALAEGGKLLFQSSSTVVDEIAAWEEGFVSQLKAVSATLYCLPPRMLPASQDEVSGDEVAPGEGPGDSTPVDWSNQGGKSEAALLDQEYLLGAIFAVLLDSGLVDQKERRVQSVRREQLSKLVIADQATAIEAFESGMGAVHKVDDAVLGETTGAVAADRSDEVPMAVEHLGRSSADYDSLPRFWDQLGVLYKNDELDQVSVDPYLGTGTIPPLSATLRDLSASRSTLPAFDPGLCTGCGKCWTGCPDSAIGVVSLSPASLLDSAIRLTGADPLRPIASQLAGRMISEGKQEECELRTAGEMIESAFSWVGAKMGLEGDRKESIEQGIGDVVDVFGALPLSVTGPFFHDAEKTRKDSAEFLSIVVNPDACKACGLCVANCEPGALREDPQTLDRVTEARSLWRTWAKTPDTPSVTIERVVQDPEVGEMAGVMLSRFCSMAMSGGDGGEAGSGEKVALRMALAAIEYQQQPLQHFFIKKLAALREDVAAKIRKTVTSSLPTEDLDLLLSSLNQMDTSEADLSSFARKVTEETGDHDFDGARLRGLLEVARDLTSLHWNLSEGPNRLGRSRFSLAVAPGSVASWAAAFPYNPFQVPVVVDMTGDVAQVASGVLEGQIAETVSSIGVVRRAELELERPSGEEWHRDAIDRMGWEDITGEEKQLCPPLILVGDDDVLAGRGFSQIAWLLNSSLPIKILVMSDLDFGLAKSLVSRAPVAAVNNPRANMGLMALAQHNAFVAQTSISSSDHLRQCVRDAVKFTGPALVLIHAPSPTRHGYDVTRTMEQARLATASRSFPLFRYDPEREGVFGSRIDLQGNIDPMESWVKSEQELRLNPAHWAFSEERFNHCFRLIDSEDKNPTPLDAWLDLDANGRRNKTAYLPVDVDGEETRYRVAPALLRVIDERGRSWRMLQELAGLVTPFTSTVQQQAEERVASRHLAELDALKQEYEEKMAGLEQSLTTDMAKQVKDQLLKLASYQVSPRAPVAPSGEAGDASDDLGASEAG